MIMTWTSMEVMVVEKLVEFWICFEGKATRFADWPRDYFFLIGYTRIFLSSLLEQDFLLNVTCIYWSIYHTSITLIYSYPSTHPLIHDSACFFFFPNRVRLILYFLKYEGVNTFLKYKKINLTLLGKRGNKERNSRTMDWLAFHTKGGRARLIKTIW